MKKQALPFLGFIFVLLISVSSCNNQASTSSATVDSLGAAPTPPKIKTEEITYKSDTTTLDSYIAYDESFEGKRPVVLVIPEWWGNNDYPKSRARQLAELGYFAVAVDMYGNGKLAPDPGTAMALAGPFYKTPQLSKDRIDATIDKIKSFPQADTANIAAIGYCFGGSVVLNAARLGENFKGVVSFHGGLLGAPAKKDLLKAKVLICHGADDSFVKQEEVDKFKKQMDSIGADYTLKIYPGATHAFTNPGSTENGKKFNLPIAYNAAADTASWKEMNEFFSKIFQ